MKIKGYNIRFIEKGEGFPLLLIHGLGASLEWWQFNIDCISQKYRVIAFDFLGFGYSTKSLEEYSLSYASEFLISLLDAFKIEKAILIGNSMGGIIALNTAIQFQQRVEKLVLVSNAGFGRKLSYLLCLGSIFPIGELALALRNEFTVRILLSQLFSDPKKLPLNLIHCVQKIFDLHRSPDAFLKTLRSGVNIRGLKKAVWHPVVKKAPSLPHPTLIIWGEHDKIIPVYQAYLGHKLIKHSELCILKKCGHTPQVERPDEFNRLVLEFLEP
ncbi:MAG: alpha/beta fold hydrolase [Candidatus Aminicenantaceae bacterium]